ncbi:MAG: response regulator [Burkholderiaceae bacterium]|nr:MAG: response regulator [Burkholderiaceae bacterium]
MHAAQILIVDDDPLILSALKRSLGWKQGGEYADWVIETFNSPLAALERARVQTFNLVLSDFRMPQMDGVTFLAEMRSLQPDATRLILSGHTDLAGLIKAINDAEIYRFIPKPWVDYELKTTLAHALKYQMLQHENRQLSEQLTLERHKRIQLEQARGLREGSVAG